MNRTKYKVITFLCISPLIGYASEAGRIKVINNNTLPLVMEIVPELDSRGALLCKKEDSFPLIFLPGRSSECEETEAPVCQKDIVGICDSTQENSGDFIVTSELLHGHQHFAVNGRSGSIVSGGSCRNLDVSKNYRISFLNDDVGTTCISEEVAPSLFSSVFFILN